MLKKNQIAKEIKSNHWFFLITLFLGFWLIFTPYAIGIRQEDILFNDQICGLLILFFSLSSLYGSKISPWMIALIGAYLQLAPLIFHVSEPQAYLEDTVIGILAIIFSIIIPGTPGVVDLEEGEIPPGWSYNPSSWVQRFPILVLGTIGWFAARLMCAYQLGFIDTIWDPFFGDGTETVITSKISQAFPIPDAGLGALAYSIEVLLGLKGGTARWRTMPWLVVGFSFLVVPLGLASIVLIILQPLVVGAWCTLCLIAGSCMLLMCLFTLDEVIAVAQLLLSAYREGHFLKVFLYGSHPKGLLNDPQTPKFPPPPIEFVVEMCRGVTLQPYLIGAALLGAFFMFSPFLFNFADMMADFAHTFGALIIVVSILSLAEVGRMIRKANHVLSLVLVISTLYAEIDPITKGLLILAAIGVSLLSVPTGCLKNCCR
ncbi:MAG: vitamin K epoxide reductase family protein [Chlamydiia bacterium]